jgi:TonB-linked SusC/RagA family outer membrane protein
LVKNADELAKLGPIASNGAIWIETKPAVPGNMKMEFNGYYGMAQQGNVMPVNAAYIRDFRQPFYDKYATPSDYLNYPAFLGDSSNLDYYGSSNWPDIYYKVTPVYHGNFSLTTGSKRANFRFFGGLTTDAGAADNTSLKKYNTNVDVNIIPFDWLKFNASVGGEHLDRARNRNIRDRMAEMRYIPELNTPIAPNKNAYGDFISLYDQVMDDNLSTLIHGFITMNIDLKKLTYTSKVAFDYNENIRDLFWPSDLMNQINYVSNYFGYNQRAYISNEINYDLKKSNYSLQLTGGAINQYDVHRYNYGMGYDGTSDFIKVNSGGYLAYRFTDEERLRLFSFYGNAKFKYKNDFELDALLRSDGSSLMLPNKRWLITPSFRLGFNLKNIFWEDSKNINDLRVSASWAKIGKLLSSDIFSAGPQYVSDIGWQGANILSAYNGMAGLSRPYADGWVGYGIDWPYTNQLDLSINGSFFKNKLDVSLSLYNKDDKNQLWQIPIPQEYGYDNTYMNGLSVNNKGVELTIGSDIIKQDHQRFQWHTDLNVSLNKNKLTQLPNGLDELAMDNHLLKVGKSIDGFWLFKNEGIYTSDDEVPRDPKTGKLLSYDGVDFKAGDPKWKDLNGDYIIDDNDKELLGHSMPQVMGGWQNTFSYKHFDLSFDLIWALGLNAINSRQSSMYDFINQGASNSLNSVWEIYTWQRENGDHLNKYPLYNPWSLVNAYQPDQDLFLENASFLKLRSATLGYDFGRIKNKKGKRTVFDDIYVYTTVTNLFTITKFSGKDPELTDINGNYTGYNIPLPRLFVFGFRVGL